MINIEVKVRETPQTGELSVTETVYMNAPMTEAECRRCLSELELCCGVVKAAINSFEKNKAISPSESSSEMANSQQMASK